MGLDFAGVAAERAVAREEGQEGKELKLRNGNRKERFARMLLALRLGNPSRFARLATLRQESFSGRLFRFRQGPIGEQIAPVVQH